MNTRINSLEKLAQHLKISEASEIDVIDHLMDTSEAYVNFCGDVLMLDGVFGVADLELLADVLKRHLRQKENEK